ncbi:Mpv17/PMP22 [Macleaya cordata]|uniref:Mpv17/PMP22 n=1 Tax=Macleaya cordata TaxID=56857 RepID=A0A200PQR1_MACCD|nr:Mpv17/PMP22 [Macleaya cordata]
MASVNSFTAQRFLPITNPIRESNKLLKSSSFSVKGLSGSSLQSFNKIEKSTNSSFLRGKKRDWVIGSVADEIDVIPVKSSDSIDQQDGVGGFANEGRLSFEGAGDLKGFSSSSSVSSEGITEGEDIEKLVDRTINATIVLAAGTFAGWTVYEILRYAPIHNWAAYEEALKTNPVLAKMVISGVVYSVGDWIAQCYEGKPLFEFDRTRMFRSGLVGFSLHGSLSHYYYQFCEALIPFDDWWVVPAKVAFDQTVWAALWNSIYFVVLGFLRFESPANIFGELKATFLPMLTAGWKLWPFAHLITYGVVPVEQRLLWVDCVELIWVTILSTYSNEKSEARNDTSLETNSRSSSISSPEE